MSESADSQQPLGDEAAEIEIVAAECPSAAGTKRSCPTPPRLGTVHLLIWTACCAAFLGAARSLAQRPAGVMGAAFLVVVAMGAGLAWAGLVITLSRAARGRLWPIEPGQWLLATLGVLEAAELFALLGATYGMRNQQAVVLAVSACAFVWPTLSRRLEPRWKWLFAAACVLFALPLLVSLLAAQVDLPPAALRTVGQLTPRRLTAALAVAAVVLAALEPGRRGRGWLHWVGVGTGVWLAGVSFAV
jgi:hypothetical protein